METFPYETDEKEVQKRLHIQPFGRCLTKDISLYVQKLDNPPKFTLSNVNEEILENDEEKSKIYVFKQSYSMLEPEKKKEVVPSNIYVPPSIRNTKTVIKIINIPLSIKRPGLEELIIKKTSHHPYRIHLVTDKETRESRGYSFVTFESAEVAKDAIKKIDKMVIDGLVLGAELAKPMR